MLSHIDVFVVQHILKKKMPFLTNESLRTALEQWFNVPVTIMDVNRIGAINPPTTQQIVHALKSLGFSPKTISEELGINATTVSYHLARPLKNQYVDPVLRHIEDEKNKKLNLYDRW